MAGVLAIMGIGLGGLAYWWWKQGDEGRMALLWPVAYAGGYGPVPPDMVEQMEWLAVHRLRDVEGMAMGFVLAVVAGGIEGNRQRQAAVLSGFGLRLLRVGRVLMLTWLGAVALYLVAPVALPYREVGGCLTFLLLCGTYTLARGMRRTQ